MERLERENQELKLMQTTQSSEPLRGTIKSNMAMSDSRASRDDVEAPITTDSLDPLDSPRKETSSMLWQLLNVQAHQIENKL